ncbi:conserved hypothetical protein [Bacillus cytotoxicus NVH 391-98]|uniref:Uncharacterized protein n=1 Tax=Bacillus cytotoxicus (strain DSM 22905 / CIP 110041 / 391-98 / NVH 391-98) TaxID=315749 RepID=A7GN38_BACCN|nr:conserved hypothetical protein [Bacillus cytotoxicus NVH 391-98]NZD31670.1 hypothetical protein [Bacillus cytotoxicus]HDR7212015.1 hypothetical protein [Bacillus cytotoxicus]
MDGGYFYFLAWMGWIITTFFMKKESIRWKMSAFILFLIICSQFTFSIASFSISMNALFISIIAFGIVGIYSVWKKLYTLFSALIVAMLYTSFHLLEVYDPIWIIINRTLMLSAALVYASVLLHRDRLLRLCTLYIGMIQGEILVAFIFRKLHFPYELGSLQFFDSIAVSTLFVAILFLITKVSALTGQFRKKHVKERQG